MPGDGRPATRLGRRPDRVRPTAPHLSAFDRGFQLGDGVFETLRARGGRPTELDEHVARLRRSADGLSIPLADDVGARLAAGDRRAARGRGTRRPGRRRQRPDHGLARRVPSAAACSRPTSIRRRRSSSRRGRCRRRRPRTSSRASTSSRAASGATRRTRSSALKTTSRADYVYARVEARAAGADDALFLTTDGFLSEATSANVFLVRGAVLATPALGCAILPGTTRDWILRWAARRRPPGRRGLAHDRATSPRPTRRSSRAASPGSCRSRASRARRSATAGPAPGRCGRAPTARRSSRGVADDAAAT